MSPRRLKRIGAFLLAAGLVLALASTCVSVVRFVRADACLDGGGRWNEEKRLCEP